MPIAVAVVAVTLSIQIFYQFAIGLRRKPEADGMTLLAQRMTSGVSPKGLDITQSFVFRWRGWVEPGLIASSFRRARSSFLMMSSTLAVQTNGRGDSFHAAR